MREMQVMVVFECRVCWSYVMQGDWMEGLRTMRRDEPFRHDDFRDFAE